ncbi:MAG: TonB-dependent receptor, partial [Pseudomonadota bacterium]|nr:TonB-dependent receptor [Pseudomonadota bacterium]
KHRHSSQLLALLAATTPLSAMCAPTDTPTLPTIEVQAKQNPYKADSTSSVKQTQPLVDTPQTITVIKKELLQDQGATTLVEALRNSPGITLQLGENGNTASGDTFQMRGFSTQNSTLVDGIRDLGATTRDVFNLEQVEVIKGPAGSEIGRGASSGYVNLVSKLPQSNNNKSIGLAWSTANHKRLTADLNQDLGDGMAARLNAMWQDGGVEGRDVVERNGYAIAPAFAFGLGADTRFYLYSQHVHQENIPDGGIPTIGREGFVVVPAANATAEQITAANAAGAAPAVNHKNYYGSVHDLEEVDAHMATVRVEHDLNDSLSIQNLTRIGQTEMTRSLTGIMALAIVNPADRNTWTVSRSVQGVDQTNKILANQTNLKLAFATGAISHDVVAGFEISQEKQENHTMALAPKGVLNPIVPPANLYQPNANDRLPSLLRTGAYSRGETQTTAIYLFDTIKLNDQLQVNAGIRADRYTTKTDALAISTNQTTLAVTETTTDLEKSDTLISWNLGTLFKPTDNSSIYASYAKSLTPPGSSNFSLSSTENNANNPNVDPQETHNYEVGAKWDVMAGKLGLSAALYRT